MKSRISGRARQDLDRITNWWLREVGAPPRELLLELRATLRLLERLPEAGVEYAVSYGRPVHRILLRNSQVHVYYRVARGVVLVVTVWSARRERGPRFYAG